MMHDFNFNNVKVFVYINCQLLFVLLFFLFFLPSSSSFTSTMLPGRHIKQQAVADFIFIKDYIGTYTKSKI